MTKQHFFGTFSPHATIAQTSAKNDDIKATRRHGSYRMKGTGAGYNLGTSIAA